MPSTSQIIINTSPLIALVAAMGDLKILESLYTDVLVPFEATHFPSHTNQYFADIATILKL
jgi:predicted nucleic acid-binding protein